MTDAEEMESPRRRVYVPQFTYLDRCPNCSRRLPNKQIEIVALIERNREGLRNPMDYYCARCFVAASKIKPVGGISAYQIHAAKNKSAP